jgi:MATE family multidrug resistance protein
LAGTGVIALITTIPEVRALANDFLPWAVLMPLVSVWAYTYDGVFLSATRTGPMRNSMILSFVGFLILVHVLMPLLGNTGLWIALTVFLALRGVTLHLFYPALLRAV